MMWMLLPNKYLGVYHRKKWDAPSDIRMATSLMEFEYQPCEIFEGLLYPQKVEYIDPTTFEKIYRVKRHNREVLSVKIYRHDERSSSHI